jgi:DNA-directed RNA polymerase specialized sigma24 family protein
MRLSGARTMDCAGEWLDSARLGRFVRLITAVYGLSALDREDVLQETRIALWQGGLETPIAKSWIRQTVTHKAVDLLRRNGRLQAGDRALAQLAAPTNRDPELEPLLHARVAELRGRLRTFYTLHYEAGLSERETATRMGVCRASIRWLDHQCRRQLLGGDNR